MIHPMQQLFCIELYPPGTLGRVFIDYALEAITRHSGAGVDVDPVLNKLCIHDPILFSEKIESVYDTVKTSVTLGNPFPTTLNDNRALSSQRKAGILYNYYKPGRPETIIECILDLLRHTKLQRLGDTMTTPSIMRLEFYEYSSPGYISSRLPKDHAYKKTNILSLGLAVLGSYILYTTRVKQERDIYNIYYLPLKDMELGDISRVKREVVSKIYSVSTDIQSSIQAYLTARYIVKYGELLRTSTIGSIAYVRVSGNRYVLYRVERLYTAKWINLLEDLEAIDHESRVLLDTIVDTIIDAYNRAKQSKTRDGIIEAIKPLVLVIEDLHRYCNGATESLYTAIRTLYTIADNIKESREKKRMDSPWIRLDNLLRSKGMKSTGLLKKLANSLASIGVYSS